MLTRQFPSPGDRQTILDDSRYPQGALKLCVPETERRQNHISQIERNHPLLQIALDCLKDKDIERPSADQLCKNVAALKERNEYKNAIEKYERDNCREEMLQDLQQTLEEKKHVIDEKDVVIAEREQQLRGCTQQLLQAHQ
jgi:hypothetical protein